MATAAPAKFRIDVDIHNLLDELGFRWTGSGRGQGHDIARTCFSPVPGTAE